ncbi:CAP domain-containing protein [Leptolyngbya sp. FACHB-261]|uniref:CAP domain-containing protein n=1 Tax=Leptolyngbya sp. FACHB-261 TaxID=2692806 RepID=UPI001688C241|nr:CAP domain-containing protein [Leptolyngbya sp. FACHB-261]MBD2104037.1 CAP domain-containing protein [Leptolyngbya sp. FACHB-261]
MPAHRSAISVKPASFPEQQWRNCFALVSLTSLLSGCTPTIQWLPPSLPPSLTQQPTIVTLAQSPAIAEIETSVQQRINTVRQAKGLGPLQSNEKLMQVARNYSKQMARQSFFSHTSPAGDTVIQRVRGVGIAYWVVGENLAKNTNAPDPATVAVQGWLDSPGHRENILHPAFTQSGVGVWRTGNTYYFTQVFLRPLF